MITKVRMDRHGLTRETTWRVGAQLSTKRTAKSDRDVSRANDHGRLFVDAGYF